MVASESTLDMTDMIPLREVPNHLPRSAGRKVALPSVYRWASHGCSGVRLQVWSIGGKSYTTHQALAEFTQACTAARGPGRGFDPKTVPRSPAKRSRAHGTAEANLKKAGW